MKRNNIITIAVFCSIIAILTAASILAPSKKFSEVENRQLQQMPEFSVESLFSGKFTSEYEEFITDQFVFRDSWISIKSGVERLLGKREVNGVYFADDGYFIEKGSNIEAERLNNNAAFLEKFAADMGDEYNLRILIAPTASLTLKDKLPLLAPTWDQASFLDRLSEIDGFIDTRNILSEHKDEYIYYRTDHHWTTYGAYLAYTELVKSLGMEPLSLDYINELILSDEFLGTVVAKVGVKSDYDRLFTYEYDTLPTVSLDYNLGEETTDSIYDFSKLDTRDKYGVFLGGNDAIIKLKTSNQNGRVLLMIKDSYSHCMLPLLINHYEEIILIDPREYGGGVKSTIKMLEGEGTEIDDIVVLYNAAGFATDRYIVMLGR